MITFLLFYVLLTLHSQHQAVNSSDVLESPRFLLAFLLLPCKTFTVWLPFVSIGDAICMAKINGAMHTVRAMA
jgi:hypothetical protein